MFTHRGEFSILYTIFGELSSLFIKKFLFMGELLLIFLYNCDIITALEVLILENYTLGDVEQKLKDYILQNYKSLREFCMQIDRSYSTIDNMLKRGLVNSSVSLVLYVCDRLNLSIDNLLSGNIVERGADIYPEITDNERLIIMEYRKHPEMHAAIDKLLDIQELKITISQKAARSGDDRAVDALKMTSDRVNKFENAETDDDI